MENDKPNWWFALLIFMMLAMLASLAGLIAYAVTADEPNMETIGIFLTIAYASMAGVFMLPYLDTGEE